MTTYPQMNLNPEATPWGRAMQQKIEELERAAERREQGEKNTNQAQNGTMTALGKNITELQELATKTIVPIAIHQSEIGFAVTGILADHAVASVLVPEGYSRAIVNVTVRAGLSNTATGGWSNLRIQSRIQSHYDGPIFASIPAGQYGNASLGQSVLLEGLVAGDTITAAIQVSFSDTSSNSSATTSGSVLFML